MSKNFYPATESEIIDIFSKLKINSSTSVFEIILNNLKSSCEAIKPILRQLINDSIDQAFVPLEPFTLKVLPVHKKILNLK